MKTSLPAARPAPEAAARWREALSDERMAHLIKDAFRGTSRALQTRLKAHDVAYAHWTLLRVLWKTDGLTQRQLSVEAGVTEPSTFSAVQAMEKLGYLTRQRMHGNDKQVRVLLTARGTALRHSIVPAAEAINRIALAGIPGVDIEATRRTLLSMIANLEAHADAPPGEDLERQPKRVAPPDQRQETKRGTAAR